MTDDFTPLSAANPAAPAPRKCVRHNWFTQPEGAVQCLRCGHIRNPEITRRNRNNAKRGKRIQRERIVALGGVNLPGNKPNHDGIGVAFSYEVKSGGFFSERVWRVLSGIPVTANQTGVLIVTETPGPGRRARSYIVVEYGEWQALHQEETSHD